MSGGIVYLLYLDESGNPDGSEDRYFVMGGLALFERQTYFMNKKVDELAEQLFSGSEIEFHAQPITQHSQEPWKSLPAETRQRTLRSLCEIISRESRAVLFAVAVEKAMVADPVAHAFEEITNRFDLYLNRLHAIGKTQRGLVIFDKSRYESRLQSLLIELRHQGNRFRRLKHMADVPFFTDSKSTRLIQLADLISYAVFRRYERSHTWLLDQVIGGFDLRDGVYHGLKHVTRDWQSCTCPSCLSRRLAPRPQGAMPFAPDDDAFGDGLAQDP